MHAAWVILASLLYAAMLFAVAWLGDRYARLTQRPGIRPLIHSLALAVYQGCAQNLASRARMDSAGGVAVLGAAI